MIAPDDLPRYAAKYGDAIRGRLMAMGCADTSDAELERHLGPCVCGDWLVPLAKSMRDAGIPLLDTN